MPDIKPEERLIKTVSCLGFADATPEDPLFKEAFEVGKALAQSGYTVANGGGPGVMRATTEGAKSVAGHVIGVTFYPKNVANFEGKDKNNPIDEEIKTDNYLERTLKLLDVGQAYVIFKGGTGTISEFGMAWGLARLYFGHHKPLLLYGKFWENIMAAFISNMRMRPEEFQVYRVVNSPEEVVKTLEVFNYMLEHEPHVFNPAEKPFQV
ncbi:MAG: LOG family protein [bacterium]|nr:LOG family protein [bacterium]